MARKHNLKKGDLVTFTRAPHFNLVLIAGIQYQVEEVTPKEVHFCNLEFGIAGSEEHVYLDNAEFSVT